FPARRSSDLAGIALYGATVADASQADALPRQVAAAAAQFANWFFVVEDTSYVNQFAAPSPVQHFWSLSVEEQFYLLLPLGIVAILACSRSRRVLGATVAGGAVLCPAWMVQLHAPGAGVDRVYYGTDTRLPEMLAGFLLAVVMSRARAPRRSSRPWTVVAWAGAVGYGASVWMFGAVGITEPLMWRGGIVAFSLLTCLVIAGVLSGAGPLRVLSWGPLPAVGRMTYGLYLYHLPVFLWLTAERTGLSQWPLFGLRVLVTFAVATVSYHLLEMPIRRGTVLTAATGRRLRFLLGPVVAVSVVALTFVTAGRAADDKWGTLRDVDAASAAPSGGDPVLDVLVITDPVGEPIAACASPGGRARHPPISPSSSSTADSTCSRPGERTWSGGRTRS